MESSFVSWQGRSKVEEFTTLSPPGVCKKLILSYTEPRFDYVNLFIIDFACKPKSESDFYYFNTFDIARLDGALVSFLVD